MTALKPEIEGLEGLEGSRITSSAGPIPTSTRTHVERGLSEQVVRNISALKSEPRVDARAAPEGPEAVRQEAHAVVGFRPRRGIDFDNIKYFVRSTEKMAATWDDLPDDISATYDKLGIPEAEKQRLVSGVAAQYESEVVYHKIREDLEEQGVIFVDTDTALREHAELFREYFTTVIPTGDNKFSALNTAVWSGGSFIYVPKGVHVDIPLQAYFRINTENMGQFERTLIIADEGSFVHYVEGCTAPMYSSDSLHSAVVEIVVKKDARVRYTTIQNWSTNVYNLVTKRAAVQAGGTMEWVDGNLGSKVTMKYPAVWLLGEHAKGETLSVAFAGENQHQDAGAKMVHAAPNTSSNIVSKSVARGGGRTSYRGLVQIQEGATGSKSTVKCDALLVDTISRSDTYPYVDVREDDASIGHEATVSKIGDDQLFYLMSRGMAEDEAMAMIVRGFIEPIARELPMEYALELNRLIELADGGQRWLTSAHARVRSHGRSPGIRRRFRSRATASRSGASRPTGGCAACSTGEPATAELAVTVSASGATTERIPMDDARVGRALVPSDRVTAQSMAAAPEALLVTVAAGAARRARDDRGQGWRRTRLRAPGDRRRPLRARHGRARPCRLRNLRRRGGGRRR